MATAKPELRSVRFPVVGRGDVAFETVHIERLTTLDRNERFALAPGLADMAIEILLDARTGDPEASRLDGVSVVVTGRGFGGKSYGLALAIADKRVRTPGSPDTPVIATGSVVNRGRGAIGAIEGFAEKVRAVTEAAAGSAAPIDFAFPAANWESAPPAVRELLTEAQREGRLRLYPCHDVGDAAALWRAASRGWRARSTLVAAIVLLAVIVGGVAWQFLDGRDARGCEAAMTSPPVGDREAIARAVDLCGRASVAAPANGRLHFQYGRALILNGSEVLAAEQWRRAAEAGDPDGMANHGRALWQSAPGDPKRVAEALDWLKRASEGGSVVATRDVGYILLDGLAAPADPKEAQRWMAKAASMERNASAAEGKVER